MKIEDVISLPIFQDTDVNYYKALERYDSLEKQDLILPILAKFPFSPSMPIENADIGKLSRALAGPQPSGPSHESIDIEYLRSEADKSIAKNTKQRIEDRMAFLEFMRNLKMAHENALSEFRIQEFIDIQKSKKMIQEVMNNILRFQAMDKSEALKNMLLDIKAERRGTANMLIEQADQIKGTSNKPSVLSSKPSTISSKPSVLSAYTGLNIPEMLTQISMTRTGELTKSSFDIQHTPPAGDIAVAALAMYSMVANLPTGAIAAPTVVQQAGTTTKNAVYSVIGNIAKKA